MKIMLFNATGMQGATTANQLKSLEHQVVAPARSLEKAQALQSQGITSFETDFSVISLAPQMERVDAIIAQIPAQVSPHQMVTLTSSYAEAILQAGYPPTVFVISSTLPDTKVGVPSVDARVEMKDLVLDKLPQTPILSATEYLENFSTAYRTAIESDGIIPQTIPANFPVNYLSWADLAQYVIAALFTNRLKGGLYRIGGREGITGNDLALRLGKAIGGNLRYQPITHEQLEGFLTPILGESIAKDYAEFYEYQDTQGQSLLNPDTTQIREMLGLTLPTLEEWAATAFTS